MVLRSVHKDHHSLELVVEEVLAEHHMDPGHIVVVVGSLSEGYVYRSHGRKSHPRVVDVLENVRDTHEGSNREEEDHVGHSNHPWDIDLAEEIFDDSFEGRDVRPGSANVLANVIWQSGENLHQLYNEPPHL